MKITVFVSGSGTNLKRIIEAIEKKELPNTEIVAVVADRDCYALERGLDNDLPTYFFDRKSDDFWEEVKEVLPKDLDYIVLAGFLSIIPKDFINLYQNRIINIHPSLLPKYGGKGMYGMHVHKAVLQNLEKKSGATVHFVTPGIDEGEIILQKAIPIKKNETPEWLATKVHQVEYEILIKALSKLEKENDSF